MEIYDDKLCQINGYFKKTKRSKVLMFTKEKYLRSDIELGYRNGLSISLDNLNKVVANSLNQHILIVDTNICLHEIDILEFKFSSILVVVILQTVLQELLHRNLSCYKRILALLADENRCFIFFPNEFFLSTQEKQLENEVINDFYDRLIRYTVLYYSRTVTSFQTLLITNDIRNKVLQ
jgi:hypothetical protein